MANAPTISSPWVQLVRRLSTAIAILCSIVFAITSRHWLLLGDASLMHYVTFLIGRGWIPYREIIDVNLPGTYAIQWIAIHLLGGGSLAWRLFDIFLGIAATFEMMLIAWPCDPLAGVLAGAIFFLIHGRDGMNELGQRDLVMTVLLLGSAACFCYALRKQRSLFIPLASLIAGIAVTIKPTAAIFWAAMLVYVLFSQKKLDRSRLQISFCGLAAFLAAPILAACTLIHLHALNSFLQAVVGLMRFHNQLLRLPATYFLLHPLPSSLLSILAIWLAVLALRYRQRLDLLTSTETLIAIGVLCGLASFYLQRKALPYHRYPADGFFILLVCIGFSRALQTHLPVRSLKITGAAGLLVLSLIVGPQSLSRTFKLHATPNDFSGLLQTDLTALGGSSLNKKVQCIDFTSGCITTLYRMQLEQSTGLLYDCYLFQPTNNVVVQQYRQQFWSALAAHSPDVIVLSNQDCGRPASFHKIDRWPQLASLLSTQYRMDKEVTPPDPIRWASTAAPSPSYRIYLKTH
jgi:hypothetical protein